MKLRSVILAVAVAVLLTPGLSQAQSLDDAAVGAALQAGVAKKHWSLLSTCIADPGFGAGLAATMAGGIQLSGAFDVLVSRAAGRIAYMAYDAKRLYKSFALADVTPDLRDDSIVFVTVNPRTPKRSGDTYEVPAPIERVVLKSKSNPNLVAQPTDVAFEAQEWSNLMGGKVQGNAAVAKFNLRDVRELPPGDVDIVVITQAGERRCKMGTKDRDKVIGRQAAASTSQQ